MTSILRQRMRDAMVLSGKAARTQEAYIGAVFGLARYYHRSPDVLTAHDVRHYLLHLLRERHLTRSSVNQYSCAFRFLYGRVLGLDSQTFQIPLAPAPQRLPEILSGQELACLFAAACHLKARTFLMLAYGSGLRLSELCRMRAEHIDSHADRMCIRVEQGKGAKDRYVPLADDVLQMLRTWWRARHPGPWLFGSLGRSCMARWCSSERLRTWRRKTLRLDMRGLRMVCINRPRPLLHDVSSRATI